jgi:plastocyanin
MTPSHARAVTILSLAVGFAVAGGAEAQYDNNPRGGDSGAPEGCVGVQATVRLDAGLVFNPARLVVAPGTPVCWTWSGMAHSVRADNGSFNSGPPAASGTFQRTFDAPGTFGYFCQLHGSPEGGMRGEIVVQADDPPPPEGPGTLQVAAETLGLGEAAGPANVVVERVGGHDGKATVVYNTVPGTAKSPADFVPAKNKVLTWNAGELGARSVSIGLKNDKAKEPAETFKLVLSKPTGAPLGAATTTVTINDDDSPSCPAGASLATGLKAAGESATQIRVAWPVEAALGELLQLERRGLRGDFREVAALSPGVGQFVDAGLLPGTTYLYRLAARGEDGELIHSDTVAAATDGAIGDCDASGGASCLLGGRFEASIERDELHARHATQRANLRRERLGEDSGIGLFTAADGPSVLLGVVASCAANRHYGITLAVLDGTEVTVRVRDTLTGKTWARFVPAGDPVALRVADAFATCP